MPRDSKKLKQTTLFDSQFSSSPVRSPKRTRALSKGKRKKAVTDSSSDDISAIKLAPVPDTNFNVAESLSGTDDPRSPRIPTKRQPPRLSSPKASEDEQPGPVARKRKAIAAIVFSSSEEDARPASHLPKRTRLRRRHSPEAEPSAEEDLTLLADEVDEERILASRFRERQKPKSTFQQNLEKLKRRKLKLKDEEDKESETEGTQCSSDVESDLPRLFKGSKPSNLQQESSEGDQSDTDNSSGFIVEDEASISFQLPAEFSMETHQDLSHQFKKVFQFFVHVAVQPSKVRAKFMEASIQDEQYFSVPLQIIRRKLAGIRDSLVSSSVWRPEFKKALEKYPEFDLIALEFAVPSCDACHLGGRMSTLLGRLSGLAYNRSGFKTLPPRRSDKNEGKEFHLGRFCARRTRVYHDFSHWEYSLFHAILREIDMIRDKEGFHTVAFFGGKRPPEDISDADGLCDWLDERQVIDIEWQKLKKIMDSAQHLELGDKMGEADD